MAHLTLTHPERTDFDLPQGQNDEYTREALTDIMAGTTSEHDPTGIFTKGRQAERSVTGRMTATNGSENFMRTDMAEFIDGLESRVDQFQGDGYTLVDSQLDESIPVILTAASWRFNRGQPYEIEYDMTAQVGTGTNKNNEMFERNPNPNSGMNTYLEIDGIELGDRVEDQLSGFEGTVVVIGKHLTGCTRVGVQSVDPMQAGEQTYLYADQVDVIEDAEPIETDHDPITESDFEVGEWVCDEVSGVEGVVSHITFELFNCPRIAIHPIADNNEEDDLVFVDEPRVESLGEREQYSFDDLIESEETASTGASHTDMERESLMGSTQMK